MRISLIVARDENKAIGRQGALPWRLSTDLRRFKSLTWGHFILMGRRTWESIGRPLTGRTNVVITRQKGYQAAGCIVVHSLEAALDQASQAHETEVFIIGGAELYAAALPRADRIYLTLVRTKVQDADVYFPLIDEQNWQITQQEEIPQDEKNEYPTIYQILERR